MLQGVKKHINGMKGGIRWMLSNSIIPNLPSRHLRNWCMRKLGMGGGKNIKFFSGFSVRSPQKLIVEDGVSIGPKVLLDARCGITIHANAVIAFEAIIWSLNHDYNDIHFCGKGAPVEIGANAWICSRSMILPGIKIGEGAIVASGAIVTKDVEPWTVVAGIPAKIIGKREKKKYEYGYKASEDYSHFM